MKKLSFVLLFGALAGFCSAQSALSLDTAIRNSIVYLRGRLPPGSRLALVSMQADTPELSRYLGQKISAALVNDGYFTIVERDDAALAALDTEMSRQLSGDVSDDTALSLGRQLGAETILSGSLTRAGSAYTMNLKALQVESARISGQISVENIRPDPLWANLARSNPAASLVFTGTALPDQDKQTLEEGLRRALEIHRITLELAPPASARPGYSFTIDFSSRPLPPSPPANTPLIQGDVTLSVSREGRVIRRAAYTLIELNHSMLLRRTAEEIQNDRAFFTALEQSLNR